MFQFQHYFYVLLLVANLLKISEALLKSQDGPLVASPAKDVVYLIEAPRSGFTISQAPLNIKVEAWLRVNKVPYKAVSSMVFLGSSTDGSVPYAELNGAKLMAADPFQAGNQSEGSNAIIQRVAEHFNLSWPNGPKGTEEQALRRQIDYDLFNTVVMYTRSSVYFVQANGSLVRSPSSFNVSTIRLTSQGLQAADGTPVQVGLQFMLDDSSIREDMFALLVDLAQPAQKTLLGVVLNRTLVHAYYDAVANGTAQDRQAFLVAGGWAKNGTCWNKLDSAMKQMVTVYLVNRLLVPQGGAFDNARKYIDLNTLDGRPVSAYNDTQIVQKVQQIYGKIATQLGSTGYGKKRLFLFGNKRTPADCSLFGSLTVFFEIPLTVPAMVEYMQAVRDDPKHPQHILVEFFEQMKVELGMSGDVWARLSKRPWPLNWESQADFEFEQQMQDVVWAAAKRAFAVGATSRLDIGNEH